MVAFGGCLPDRALRSDTAALARSDEKKNARQHNLEAETESRFGTFDSNGNYTPRQIIDADLGGVDIEDAYTSAMVVVEDGQLVEGQSCGSTKTKFFSTSATSQRA